MYMKALIAAALVAAMPSLASEKAPPAEVVRAEKPTGLIVGYAKWPINDAWQIEVRHICRQVLLFEFWPLSPACEGYLDRNPNDVAAARLPIEALAYRLQARSSSRDPRLRVAGELGSPEELFKLLLAQESPVISVDGKLYELEGFRERHAAVAEADLQAARSEAWAKRGEIVGMGLGFLAFLAVAIYLLRHARVAASKVGAGVKLGVAASLAEAERRKVRNVVIDEAIRQTTRSAIAGASEEEKAALRGQIKQALDSGNHELALSLTSVLQKLDRA